MADVEMTDAAAVAPKGKASASGEVDAKKRFEVKKVSKHTVIQRRLVQQNLTEE